MSGACMPSNGIKISASAVSFAVAVLATQSAAHDLPPPGRAGQCYAQVVHAPVYRTITEQVPGAPVVSFRDIPAVLGHGTKQVLVSAARIERETIPATYQTVPHWTDVPGRAHWVKTPAVYKVVTEQRMISPAHLEWRPGAAAPGFQSTGSGYGQTVRPTGEVLCRVMIPARYARISRRELVTSAGWRRVEGPPRHVVCYEKRIATPARVVEHHIAAQYRTVATTWVVHQAEHQRVTTAGPVRVVQRRVLVSPAFRGWAPLRCASVHAGSNAAAPSADRNRAHAVGRDAPQPTQGRPYPPDAILAPTPPYPSTYDTPPAPAPYDVGHPAH
jgi:hypothetical protein